MVCFIHFIPPRIKFINNMAECRTSFDSSVLEGFVKYREKKKWKQRWCVLKRLSPVADSLTLNVYKEQKNTQKRTLKFSVNLENLLGLESGFLLEKESQTLAVICKNVQIVLGFDCRETLLHWQAQIVEIIGKSEKFEVQILSSPPKSKINCGPAILHLRDWQFSLTNGIPPRLLGTWHTGDLRRYGAIDERRFCFEGGTRCSSGGEGFYCISVANPAELGVKFELASSGKLENGWLRASITSPSGVQSPVPRHRLSVGSRSLATTSKPSTPLLGMRARNRSLKLGDTVEPCLSPPCVRHLRPGSQQHSRTSSVSSDKDDRPMGLQKSDPVLLYDKPRSLNVTVASVFLEQASRPSSSVPEDHYDRPRNLQVTLQSAKNGRHFYEEAALVLSRVTGTSSSARVLKTQKKSAEYLLMQPVTVQPSGQANFSDDYVHMQPLACCHLPATETESRVSRLSGTVQSSKPSRTLPRNRESSVSLRLRRSASMPCRQGNRDSSDSTDSGVSITAEAPLGMYVNNSHVFPRHWSLPRPAAQSSANRLQPWPNTVLCDKRDSGTNRSTSSSSSDVSQLLDQLNGASTTSLSYETCI